MRILKIQPSPWCVVFAASALLFLVSPASRAAAQTDKPAAAPDKSATDKPAADKGAAADKTAMAFLRATYPTVKTFLPQ